MKFQLSALLKSVSFTSLALGLAWVAFRLGDSIIPALGLQNFRLIVQLGLVITALCVAEFLLTLLAHRR